MAKKNYTYSLEPKVEEQLDKLASQIYRSKSSIVQEAIMDWILKHEKK